MKNIEQPEECEMSFINHLEELRLRIIYSLIVICLTSSVSWFFIESLIENIFLFPANYSNIELQNLKPFGQFLLQFKIAIISGIFLSLPFTFFHIWKFISPALRKNEKKSAAGVIISASLSFFAGTAFALFLVAPMTLEFAVKIGTEFIENRFSLDEYFDIIFSLSMFCGIIFELPVMSFILSRIGILHPGFMIKYRKHSFIIFLTLGAILSPGTDPFAQILLTIPLVLLYEISIFVSKLSQKKIE